MSQTDDFVAFREFENCKAAQAVTVTGPVIGGTVRMTVFVSVP